MNSTFHSGINPMHEANVFNRAPCNNQGAEATAWMCVTGCYRVGCAHSNLQCPQLGLGVLPAADGQACSGGYVCVCDWVRGVDRLSFRLSCLLRPSGALTRRLGFSCMCAARVPVTPAVGAVPLCLVPRWHRGRCDVSVGLDAWTAAWVGDGSCSVVGLAFVVCAFGGFLP